MFGIYVATITLTGIGCPIRWFTGVPCPGCGMTRSLIALLHLDLKKSFYYHPLTIVAIPFLVYVIIGKKPLFNNKKVQDIAIYTFISIMLFVWILRLILLKNSEYFIDINNSFVVKLYKIIKELLP